MKTYRITYYRSYSYTVTAPNEEEAYLIGFNNVPDEETTGSDCQELTEPDDIPRIL